MDYVLENLKMKLKALAAVVALAFAGTANAAFENDGSTVSTGSGNGSGSVVLSVVDDTASVDTSIAIDLGITSGDVLYGSVSGVLLTGNADLNAFLASATGTVKWDVTAIINDGTTYELGMLQTVTSGTMPTHVDADVFNAMGRQGAWMNDISHKASGNVAIFADATSTGGHYDSTGNHQTPASVNSYATESGLGDSVDFLAILAGYGPEGLGKTLSKLKFDYTGGNATLSVVPVPAAAWLFGSALLGMVGVARRKAA
jgi:hypothetical protein